MTFTISILTTTTSIDYSTSVPAPGVYRGRLVAADGTVAAEAVSESPSFSFPSITEGDYIAEVSRLDVNGVVIVGVTAPVSARSVPAPVPTTISADVPSVLTVTVTAE